MTKWRKLSTEAKPPTPQVQSIEVTDSGLKAALVAATLAPSPVTYRAAADEYRRLYVFDRAYHYLNDALLMAPQDAATYDALARLWRDSGVPELGLGDAYRAVFFASDSAIAHNTLGTVLQALGRRELAASEYERALALDPGAAYALNNLCYGLMLQGKTDRAVNACERALAIQPGLRAAQNNLALAHAVAGNSAASEHALEASGDRAAALYNSGIIAMAQRRYSSAVEAFQAAHTLKPAMPLALARAQQAAKAAAGKAEE